MRIRKGDQVVVRTGKYAGQRSEVMQALPDEGRVILRGLNVAKRHTRPQRATTQAGIIDKFMPMPASAVSILCGSCHRPTRVGMQVDEDGAKTRICRKCGAKL